MVLFCCLLEYRSNNDIYSVLDIPGYADKPVTTKSNMVVDTIRIISGIPQSRMQDIMDETERKESSEDKESLVVYNVCNKQYIYVFVTAIVFELVVSQ